MLELSRCAGGPLVSFSFFVLAWDYENSPLGLELLLLRSESVKLAHVINDHMVTENRVLLRSTAICAQNQQNKGSVIPGMGQ